MWATVNEDDVERGQLMHQLIAFVARDSRERLRVPWGAPGSICRRYLWPCPMWASDEHCCMGSSMWLKSLS
jgi:hypothetical protein